MNISKNLKSAINSVWQYIGGEFPEDIPNEDAVEMCLDADRLTSCADNPEAHREYQELIKTHGFTKVLVAVVDVVSLN